MTKFNLQLIPTLILVLCLCAFSSFAQSKVTIVQKIQQEDGTFEVSKKEVAAGEEADRYIESLRDINGEVVSVHVMTEEDADAKVDILDEKGEMIFYVKSAKGEEETVNIFGKEMENFSIFMHDTDNSVSSFTSNCNDKKRTERPFLGIYLEDEGEGILVTDVISGSAADEAGLQSGDRIVAIDGNEIDEDYQLRNVLRENEVGESVDIAYKRGDQQLSTTATLKSRRNTYANRDNLERDPCKVFIGVSLGGSRDMDKGIYVNGIIDGTPAEASEMQSGDVIVAMDGVEVNTFGELLVERNKHEPGDQFTLSILRAGSPMEVNAQFKSCDQEEEQETTPETPSNNDNTPEPEAPETPEFSLDNNLELLDYKVFPNPSFGEVNVKFSGEAVPTMIRVVDLNGKEVYREEINQFNGTYEKQLNLRNTSTETLYLQIQQGDQSLTKMLQVLPRA